MISLKHKIRDLFPKRKRKIHLKGITTLIGAGCINFLIGAIFSLCTLAIYEISYVKKKGGKIEIENITFYYPIELFFQCISSFISGSIYKKLGLHLTNFIGVLIICLGYYIMYISSSLALDLISMSLGGIGTGIIFYPSTINAYEWFKNHNGLIVGIMETMISFGSFFFSYIGEKIINKNQEKSDKVNNVYDFEIAKKMKYFLIVLIISLGSAFILSFILMFKKKSKHYNKFIPSDINKPKEQNKNIINNLNVNNNIEKNKNNIDKKAKNENMQKITEEKKGNFEENINIDNSIRGQDLIDIETTEKKNNNTKDANIKDINYTKNNDFIEKSHDGQTTQKNGETSKNVVEPYLKNNLKENENENESDIKKSEKKALLFKMALKSKRLKLFCAIVILLAPVSNMAFTLYREIGEHKKIDVKYLQRIGSYYFIFECLSSFIFGILSDYIQLKYLLLFINLVGTITGYVYCLTFKNSLLFFMTQNFISFAFGGYYSIKDCYLMKVFGKEIYIELSSFVSLMDAFAINILTPLTYFILSKFEDKDKAYWTIFVSFGTLNLIGLVLNIFLKETKIDLNERIQKQKNEKKEI